MKEENKGITLIALVITITVLLILAGISIYKGKETIQRAELEELKTNMLFIQAKAKEYVEEANFKMGINPTEDKISEIRNSIYVGQEKLQEVDVLPPQIPQMGNCAYYTMTSETKQKWGLEKLEDEEDYIIEFNETDASVQIYYLPGYNGKYSLSDIDKIGKE